MDETKLYSWFLGPKAENADMLERLVLEALRDCVFRRRNFHPEDDIIITEKCKSGNQSLVARVDLKPGSAAEVPHYRAIGDRHTNRSAYDRERDLAPAVIEAFKKQVLSRNTTLLSFSAGDREGKLFAEGTIDATAKFIADPMLLKDSHHWLRYSLQEVNEKRDGLSVIGLGMPEWQTRIALSLPESWLGDFGRKWLDATESQHCATAPRFGVIAVRNRDDKAQLLEAGRLWQRLHLEATLQGVAMHPLNQL